MYESSATTSSTIRRCSCHRVDTNILKKFPEFFRIYKKLLSTIVTFKIQNTVCVYVCMCVSEKFLDITERGTWISLGLVSTNVLPRRDENATIFSAAAARRRFSSIARPSTLRSSPCLLPLMFLYLATRSLIYRRLSVDKLLLAITLFASTSLSSRRERPLPCIEIFLSPPCFKVSCIVSSAFAAFQSLQSLPRNSFQFLSFELYFIRLVLLLGMSSEEGRETRNT